MIGTWTVSAFVNARIYNNTFVNCGAPVIGILNTNDGGEFRNNVLFNSRAGVGSGFGRLTHSHNFYIDCADAPLESTGQVATGSQLVHLAQEDFRLSGNTTAGFNTGSPFDVDMHGSNRLTWTRGAFEAGSSGTPLPGGGTGDTPQTPPTGAISISSGLQLYLRLKNSSGTTSVDLSGNRNTAAHLNGASWTPLRFDGGLSLDGSDDHLRIPTSQSLENFAGGVSVCAWVKPEKNGVWQAIARKVLSEGRNDFPFSAYDLTIEEVSGTPRARMSASTSGGTRGLVYSNAPIAYGRWVHLAGTFDGSTLRIFVDGVESGVAQFSGGVAVVNQPLLIGRNGVGSDAFKGLLDELRIYNRALTTAEVQAVRGVPPDVQGVGVR